MFADGDYETIGTKLSLRMAVVVQPLTPLQVEAYVSGLGTAAKHLRNAINVSRHYWNCCKLL